LAESLFKIWALVEINKIAIGYYKKETSICWKFKWVDEAGNKWSKIKLTES